MPDMQRRGCRHEAASFAALVRQGHATIEQSYAEIGDGDPYRRMVRAQFDYYLLRDKRVSADRKKRIRAKRVAEIHALLRRGWPYPQICEATGYTRGLVEQIGRQSGRAFVIQRRGRRFTAEQRANIIARLQHGDDLDAIGREFRLSYFGLLRFRRMAGVARDLRRHREPLSPQELAWAREQRRAGRFLRDIARELNTSRTSLCRWMKERNP